MGTNYRQSPGTVDERNHYSMENADIIRLSFFLGIFMVVAFEVILIGMAMFNHGNVGLPKGFDRILRLLVVTPDMHRVHHSIYLRETNSNFGFNLSWWDRIFGTYMAQPKDGHLKMTIGLR